jgi:competence protein ComEA
LNIKLKFADTVIFALLILFTGLLVYSLVPFSRYSLKETKRPAQEVHEEAALDINQAGFKELEALEGIGPVLATKIIRHREANGLFKDINELKDIEGIGDVKFEKLKTKLKVD